MKYMTKQWYMDMQLETLLPYDLQVDPFAEYVSNTYFRKLYAQKKAQWLALRAELMADWGKPFDPNEEARWFARNYQSQKRRLLIELPQELLSVIADIRVLALGHCTECVYALCRQFLEEKRAEYKRCVDAYYAYVETELKDIPFANESFHDGLVKSLRRKGNHLVLEFDDPDEVLWYNRILFKNPTVLKRDRRLSGAQWLYHELYQTADGYEIHVLLWRWKKKELIDFIIQCDNVAME